MSIKLQLAFRWTGHARAVLAALLACFLVTACATPPVKDNQAVYAPMSDPLEGLNRHIFAFNDAVDTMLVRPAAYVYREGVPRPIKGIVSNFLGHLTLPLTIIHDLLQGKPERAQIAFGRFFLNTIVGLGGLFDIATPAGFPMHKEDMGQTFAIHGAASGPYLVLPLLGPSSVRDAAGKVADTVIDPVSIATYGLNAGQALRIGRAVADGVVTRERLIEPLAAMRASLDYYAAVRSAYRQQRVAQILDGAQEPAPNGKDPFATFENEEKQPNQSDQR